MECNCVNSWVRALQACGEACRILTLKNKPCTVVDAGCGNMPKLYELKRHLKTHNIECHTIGIDIFPSDIEADEFINKDIFDVKMKNIADVVICEAFLPTYKDNDS